MKYSQCILFEKEQHLLRHFFQIIDTKINILYNKATILFKVTSKNQVTKIATILSKYLKNPDKVNLVFLYCEPDVLFQLSKSKGEKKAMDAEIYKLDKLFQSCYSMPAAWVTCDKFFADPKISTDCWESVIKTPNVETIFDIMTNNIEYASPVLGTMEFDQELQKGYAKFKDSHLLNNFISMIKLSCD